MVSKVLATTVTYPYQVLKSRLQQRDIIIPTSINSNNKVVGTSTTSAGYILQSKYSGVIHCTMQIIRNEGFRGFYRGFIANCYKVAPTAAITFTVYEHVLKRLSNSQML